MRRVPLAGGAEFDAVRAFVAAADAGAEPPDAELGPGDDAAAIAPREGERIVLSADVAVEEVHFRRAWFTWETVGFRAVAAALSDLAAMAARPIGVLVAVALPPELGREELEGIGAGAGECLRRHGAALLGGDLGRSPGPVVLSVTAAGGAARPVGRGGARPGDELWVTGVLGEAASALSDLRRGLEPEPTARRSLERPAVRLGEARWLAERAELRAVIDLSDGLAGDARHLAAASGVRVVIEADRLPLAPPLRDWAEPRAALRLAAGGGEDYELLAAAPPGTLGPLAVEFEDRFGIGLTRVGEAGAGEGVVWVDPEGSEVPAPAEGFDHFSGGGGTG